MIALNEYVLRLSTGEELQVSELVMAVLRTTPEAEAEFGKIRHLCTEVTAEEIEDAKIGYDRPLLRKLRAPPSGCLLKSPSPVCALIRSCSMAKPPECTTKFSRRGKPAFPRCWTWSEAPGASEVCDAVVHAWREGRHVIVVT